jgi:hypothetical protein
MELWSLVFPSNSIGQPNKSFDFIPVQMNNSLSQSPSEAVGGCDESSSRASTSHPPPQVQPGSAIRQRFSIISSCRSSIIASVSLSQYLALHHDKVLARSFNAIDAT